MRKHSTKVAGMAALFVAGLLLLPAGPAIAQPAGCGASQNGNIGTCNSPDCATWTATGRVFRDGVVATCESPKGCPGIFNPTATFIYDAYYFDVAGIESGCDCVDVDFNNGTCGTNVHGNLYAGIHDPQSTYMCGVPGDFDYMADQGGSLATNDPSGIWPDTPPVNNPEAISVVSHTNFGGGSGCSYSFTIACRPAESLACALAPIEAKLDALAQ